MTDNPMEEIAYLTKLPVLASMTDNSVSSLVNSYHPLHHGPIVSVRDWLFIYRELNQKIKVV